MTASKTKLKKPKYTKAQQELATRYRQAWDYLYAETAEWVKKVIIDEPEGRHAKELTHEVAKLAESNRSIPAVRK